MNTYTIKVVLLGAVDRDYVVFAGSMAQAGFTPAEPVAQADTAFPRVLEFSCASLEAGPLVLQQAKAVALGLGQPADLYMRDADGQSWNAQLRDA
jgi:hypothetical protein